LWPIAVKSPLHTSIKQVTIDRKNGIRGPSKVVHFYEGSAQEQIAARLARTHAQSFPHDLLSVETIDGPLIVGCRTRNYRLAIPAELPRVSLKSQSTT